jgi:hypothetical protein
LFTVSRSYKGTRASSFAGLATLAVLFVFAGQEAMHMDVDLEPFKWKNRLLFVFAPERSDPLFDSLQREVLARKQEADDRDLLVFEVLELGASLMEGAPLDPQAAASLRKRFDIPPKGSAVIRVGKDGGIKLREKDPVRLDEIFNLIDSMPMRQDEMRRRNNNP